MSTQRTHYVTTTDGVTIGATVHGQGPPLVFLQGAMGEGDRQRLISVARSSFRASFEKCSQSISRVASTTTDALATPASS